jgi:cellulose synthase/poly-beta-1,6-N-acetylglucosamine synthase-like glycosyltransferase
MSIVIIETLSSLSFLKAKDSSLDRVEMPDTVVSISAHNDESLIHKTLESLSVNLPIKCRLVGIAHNCSDDTAKIARLFGAELIEANDNGEGGKPDALKIGLRYLDASPPEVVVIIYADCLIGEDVIRKLATEVKRVNHAVMGAYTFSPPAGSSQMAEMSSLAVLLKSFIRPLGLHQLGLPCLLNGSGSAYPFNAIRNAPHGEGSIAEDFQLTIDLQKNGV